MCLRFRMFASAGCRIAASGENDCCNTTCSSSTFTMIVNIIYWCELVDGLPQKNATTNPQDCLDCIISCFSAFFLGLSSTTVAPAPHFALQKSSRYLWLLAEDGPRCYGLLVVHGPRLSSGRDGRNSWRRFSLPQKDRWRQSFG